ncbi:MAG: hypothetical protein JSW58_01255 [Candidatus Latescibacterota bacterium]|nr:MAG: hypothetical protein JSW58_01255 [Candidatus Latescibacterota bacterium]
MKRFSSVLPVVLVALAFMFGMTSLAMATQIVYRTPKQMGEQASLVVQGKVTSVRSFWNERRTKIFTETFVQIDEAYKGTNPGSVRIIQLGGTVGKIKVTVAGALQWRPGEEVLLFLEEATPDAYHVSGFSQGKFSVERDPVTGEAFVRRPALEGAEVLGAPPSEEPMTTSRVVKVPLTQFIDDALSRR